MSASRSNTATEIRERPFGGIKLLMTVAVSLTIISVRTINQELEIFAMTPNHVPHFGTHLPMFILDVLRHDVIEQLSSIVKMLNNDGCIGWRNYWPHDFTEDEVAPVLRTLVEEGYVQALRENETSDEVVPISFAELNLERDQEVLWFSLTEKGRQLWNKWEPPEGYP
ncbi:MAG: hypothetical protein KatS3mg107_1247 [Gemmataceae bacterium]|nr:MAG: hypothetical protein KatS3mg107_1247 [Gemmataceae bacterium]